jgi:hypothetical protein
VSAPAAAPEAREPMPTRIEVREGTELTVDVLRWDEGWDFDAPVCVLRPVIRFSPNGEHTDEVAESLAENAAVDGFVTGDVTENGLVDRQFPIALLRRRWSEAWRGKDFPLRQYTAARYHVRFSRDADGEMQQSVTEVTND